MKWNSRPLVLAAVGTLLSALSAMAQEPPVNDAPTGTVKINEGKAAATRSTAVLLTLAAVDDGGGPISMCISNTISCGVWMAYTASPTTMTMIKSWKLPSGSGERTVNVWFRDQSGKTTPTETPYSATITLDTMAPRNGVVTAVPGDSKLTLNWAGFDDGAGSGIARYRVVFQKGSIAPSCAWGAPVPGYLSPATTLEHTGLVNGTTYAYRVCAIDAVGNISSGATTTGKPVDRTPPTGTVTINRGAASTNSTAATLSLKAADAGGGAIQMCISNTGACSAWTAFVASPLTKDMTLAWKLLSGSGVKTVNVWFRDRLGNASATPVSDTIFLDTTAPTGTLTINGGAAFAASTAATLTLVLNPGDPGDGAIQMCVSNTATCSNWSTFAATRNWTLAAGSGTRTVNVWFRDQWGNVSAPPASDTIFLDTTAPLDGTVTAAPDDAQLTLHWSGFDDGAGSGITGYRAVFQEGNAPASCDAGTLIPDDAGLATTLVHTGLINGRTYGYRVCAIDAAGNRSAGATTSGEPELPDTAPPTGTVTINGGAAFANSTAATLALTAGDEGGGPIWICLSDTDTCSDWEAFAATKNWTLAPGNGTRTVNIWFQDQWGNASAAPESDTIFLDTAEPTDGTVTATPGVAQQLTLRWSGFADSGGSGITGYLAVFQEGSAPASCDEGTLILDDAGTAMTLVHTGLVDGTTYGYRVCAIDAVGHWSTGATVTGEPGAINCHVCHDGSVALAPDVMPFYNVNGHGTKIFDPDGSGPLGTRFVDCSDCHELASPNPSTHLNDVLETYAFPGSTFGGPNSNTSHLVSSFFGTVINEQDWQVNFDNNCYKNTYCHRNPPSRGHRHEMSHKDGVVRFGDHSSVINPKMDRSPIIYWTPWTIKDISTDATPGENHYAPCVACHDPHGADYSGYTGCVDTPDGDHHMMRVDNCDTSYFCNSNCHRKLN